MASEFDIEKSDGGDSRERGLMLVIAVLIVSFAVHVGLMYLCSEYSFVPGPGDVKADHGRKWTKDLPTMQVQKMSVDPLARELQVAPRPAAAPDAEKQEQRVDRLAASSKSALVPEMPAAASTAPIGDVAPDPAKVEAAEWQPRQEIAAVEVPVVPDEEAALPRIVIPKVERVAHAADITPSFELLKSPEGAPGAIGNGVFSGRVPAEGGESGGAGGSDAPLAAAPPPVPGLAGGLVEGGLAGQPPSLSVLSAVEEAAAKNSADAAREADRSKKAERQLEEQRAQAERPMPPAPETTQVDEKVVAREKEAVRVLRDEMTPQGRPFERHVSLGIGSWTDPAHPAFKYFRVEVHSRNDQPLPLVSKDLVFLMDASGSIANDRLKKCRRAVVKALRMLNTGDRFNVIAFRDKFSFAFPKAAWVDVTEKNLELAEDWLGDLTAHGQTDLFRSLRGVLAMPRDPARPVVAFVITDGEPTAGLTRNAEIISKFAELNGGLVSVFMYGVKDTANDYLMDMLTRGSRGTWGKNAKLRWNAADGIPEMAKKFERPVLTDVAILFSASSRAEVYPQLVNHLCEDEPVVVYGLCPADQKELVFSMRGLNGATAYENVFRIPFDAARKLDASVKTEWAQRRLYAMIAAQTANPSAKQLEDIRAFARAYGIPVPYEKEIK